MIGRKYEYLEVQVYDFEVSDTALAAWTLFHQTWSSVYRMEEQEYRNLGITPEHAGVLLSLMYHPGPVRPAELSRMCFRKSQSIAGLLDRMERRGLVTRVRKPRGRHLTEVRLSDRAKEIQQPALEANMALAQTFTSELSAQELGQLVKLLRKLRKTTLEKLEVQLRPAPSAAGGKLMDV